MSPGGDYFLWFNLRRRSGFMLISNVGVILATAALTRDYIGAFTIEARPSGKLKYARSSNILYSNVFWNVL